MFGGEDIFCIFRKRCQPIPQKMQVSDEKDPLSITASPVTWGKVCPQERKKFTPKKVKVLIQTNTGKNTMTCHFKMSESYTDEYHYWAFITHP